jgi:hypothetical protein
MRQIALFKEPFTKRLFDVSSPDRIREATWV